jgi:dehydrogenase/reductase SDR family protein 4
MTTAIQTKKLEGKIAVVTASTDGIGLAIAQKLAQDGARVVISSRKEVVKLTAQAKNQF